MAIHFIFPLPAGDAPNPLILDIVEVVLCYRPPTTRFG